MPINADNVLSSVVIGGQGNGLGVVRSLAMGGVSSVVVDTTRRRAAMWSRWSKGVVVDQLFGRRFVEDLLALQRGAGVRPVLTVTDEMSVDTISEFREELRPHYRINLPSAAMVTTLGNKALFQHFAEQCGLPVPRTVVIERESDIARISELALPLIVKPADKRLVHLNQVERAYRLETMQETLAACRQMLKTAGTIVVQEWIEGRDSNIYFSLFHCCQTLPSRSIFFGRKMASYPPGVGSTAVCVAAPEAANLLRQLTEKFLDISEYQGLGSLEFKWDSQARRFFIVEPTVGRTDSQEEIATLSGVNLPLIAYRHALGLPPPPDRPFEAVAWRESFRHFKRCSGLDPGMPTFDGYWRIDDPLPAVVFYADSACRIAGRLLRERSSEKRKAPFRRRRMAWPFGVGR